MSILNFIFLNFQFQPISTILRLVVLYILACISSQLSSQELPGIQNYTPKDYEGEYQNWDISQSISQNIFIANHTSLLEFNGNQWQRYKLPNPSIIRSVEVVGEKIYTGSYREFGYWKKDGTGKLVYTSLSEKLKTSLGEDEEFWDILVLENWALFQSLDRIYIYDFQEDSFKIIEATSKKAKLHLVNNRVFFQIFKKGLFTIEKGKALLVSDHPTLKNQSIIGYYELQDKVLLLMEDAHFHVLDNNSLVPWPTSIDRINLKIYSSIKLRDGSFMLGSIANGLYQLSADGKLMRNINQTKGLNNNTVLSLFEDAEQNVWLGLDNGISVINMHSPFNEYMDKQGNLGLVYTAIQHKGYLYLGTNQGLFAKRINTSDTFQLIEGTAGQVWNLQLVHSTLFCGHNSGTFAVKGTSAELISDFPGTWGIKAIDHDDGLILQGNYNGLSVLEYKKGSWSLRNTIEGFSISSRFFEVDSLNVVVNHEQKGLYFLELDENMERVASILNTPRMGHGSNLFNFNGKLYHKAHNGIYKFHNDKKAPVLDTVLSKMVFTSQDPPISIIIPDSIGQKLWFFTNNAIKYISQSPLSGKLSVSSIHMPSDLGSNLGVTGFENISRITDNKYLIGSSNGYVTLDLEKIANADHTVVINTIYHGNYQNIASRTALDTLGTFTYSHNNIQFRYNVPEFDKFREVRYQYRLLGLYDNWSEWSEISETTFNNLPFGEYEFNVRAQVGNNKSKNVASYEFLIQRPWHLSNIAILLYFLGLIFLFTTVHKLYKRKYRKKQEFIISRNQKELERRKLEEKERIAQILNEKLQNEIEGKNRELAISTMSILRKNKFLSYIKSHLNNIPGKDKNIRYVIKEIDQNIHSEDDWKFFEDAFNNADKDFLKRIKTRHETLTPNDLKLCAYLRLNLSSKEIAPLLNISVKSVEMKRYRLRKKFDLPHQDNLIDYILNF